jgi:hypothetical protein
VLKKRNNKQTDTLGIALASNLSPNEAERDKFMRSLLSFAANRFRVVRGCKSSGLLRFRIIVLISSIAAPRLSIDANL